MWCDGRDLAVDTQQLIDSHLSGAHRILHREDDIIWNLDNWLTNARFFGRPALEAADRHAYGA